MITKHRWRPATLPHGGQILAACSRQAMRFCYRCHLLECRLGSHCSAAQHCRNSPVSHCQSKWERQRSLPTRTSLGGRRRSGH